MYKILFLSLILISILAACKESNQNITDPETTAQVVDFEIPDWTESTHSKSADPNYDVVFPQDQVNRINIVLDNSNWQVMLDDMAQNYGNFGTSSGGGRPPMPGDSDENPVYVPCSVFFNGIEWYQVGVRFKGNSSLRTSWTKGIWKIPLRLNFDRYEDDYPQIDNQRFYGFKELSLSSGYDDKSLIREKVAPEIFRELNVPAPQTAFYRIYIHNGSGSRYFGLYTAVEVVDDTVIEEQFKSDDGNCYKPEGPSVSFAEGGLNLAEFENKTNDYGDWSDIEALYKALHSAQRTSNPEAWRISLESIFDVDTFLRWLAVNIIIQNWDTYGKMPHNYYLYNNPENNLLTWIPWDNNEAFQSGKQGGALSLSCSEVTDDWPLIRFLLDDDTYNTRYKGYLEEVANGAFEPAKMTAIYQQYHDLISPYAVGTDGEQPGYTFLNSDADFSSALNQLISHVSSRYSAVQDYLN